MENPQKKSGIASISFVLFIPFPIPNQLLIQACRVTPDWGSSLRCPATMLAPFLVSFPSADVVMPLGDLWGIFLSTLHPHYSCHLVCSSFTSIQQMWCPQPLPHWPEWIPCGLAHPWVCTGTRTNNGTVPRSQTHTDMKGWHINNSSKAKLFLFFWLYKVNMRTKSSFVAK